MPLLRTALQLRCPRVYFRKVEDLETSSIVVAPLGHVILKLSIYLEADAVIETSSSTLPVASASVTVALTFSSSGIATEEKRIRKATEGQPSEFTANGALVVVVLGDYSRGVSHVGGRGAGRVGGGVAGMVLTVGLRDGEGNSSTLCGRGDGARWHHDLVVFAEELELAVVAADGARDVDWEQACTSHAAASRVCSISKEDDQGGPWIGADGGGE